MFRSAISRRFSTSAVEEEIRALELKLATLRASVSSSAPAAQAASGSDADKFVIGTFNAISSTGLQEFPTSKFSIAKMEQNPPKEPHAILLRSHKLLSSQVPNSVRAIARCGSGVNNIPVDQMTVRGIPVFNTPGANANAVKELTICALLLSSRGVIEGIEHVKKIYAEDGTDKEKVKKRIENEKKFFVGQEMKGKRLGVIGLGFIGASVAEVGLNMGMHVTGYDPMLTVESAWKLPGDVMNRATSLEQLLETSDYISLHVPYSKNTHHMLNASQLAKIKKNCHIVNYARGELIDTAALRALMDSGARTGRYVCDFPDENIQGHKLVTTMPHLGASTEEAEENAAGMAAKQIIEFIETGQIRNSVNFPTTLMPFASGAGSRLCVVNRNVPGMLGLITSTVGAAGLNILQQMNTSRDQIAYNVVDLAVMPTPDKAMKLLEDLRKIDGVVSSRLIQGKFLASERRKPGFFVVNTGEE